MGFWGVLLELARVLGPHAARAAADAVKDRRSAVADRVRYANQPSNESLAEATSDLSHRLDATEERAAAAEEKLSAAETLMAQRWDYARKIILGLMIWNGMLTLGLIVILIYVLRR